MCANGYGLTFKDVCLRLWSVKRTEDAHWRVQWRDNSSSDLLVENRLEDIRSFQVRKNHSPCFCFTYQVQRKKSKQLDWNQVSSRSRIKYWNSFLNEYESSCLWSLIQWSYFLQLIYLIKIFRFNLDDTTNYQGFCRYLVNPPPTHTHTHVTNSFKSIQCNYRLFLKHLYKQSVNSPLHLSVLWYSAIGYWLDSCDICLPLQCFRQAMERIKGEATTTTKKQHRMC